MWSNEMTTRANVKSGLGSTGGHNRPWIKLSRKTCLKCCKGGNVLVCKNGDCQIVVHESCLSTAAHFDDNGNFFCPYCFYKQSVVECREAKEKALLAKKAVSSCLELKMSKSTGYVENAKSVKRKEPDSLTNMQIRNAGSVQKVETDETVYQPMQIESDHCWEKGTAAQEYENMVKDPERTINIVGVYQSRSLGKEQTQKEHAPDIFEESDKGSESVFGDDYALRSEMAMKFKNSEQHAGIEDRCGRTEERETQVKSPKSAIYPTEDNAFVAHEELGCLGEKHQESAKTVEGYDEDGVEKQQKQGDVQDSSVCFMRNNDTTEIHAEFDCGNDGTFEDNYLVRTQMTENSENEDQPSNVGDGIHGRENEGEIRVNSLIDVVHTVRKDTLGVIHGESGLPHEKFQKIVETMEGCEGVEKKLIQVEPQDPSVCLTRKDNTMEIHEDVDKGSDCIFQDDSIITSPMIENSKNLDQPAEAGEDCCGKTDEEKMQVKPSKKAVYSTRKDNSYVSHDDSGKSIGMSQETAKEVEGYVGVESDSMFQDDCLVKNQKSVDSENADAEIDYDDCGRTDDREAQATLLESDVHSTESVVVTDEECEDGDSGALSENSHNSGNGIHSKSKSKVPEDLNNDNQLGESSESSETDFSEFDGYEGYEEEEVTRGNSR